MPTKNYAGFDIHKKIISFCIKTMNGKIVEQGVIPANRKALHERDSHIKNNWVGALEAILLTGEI